MIEHVITKTNILIAFTIAILGIGMFCIGLEIGLNNSKNNTDYEHYLLKRNGYNYCPYCGNELKEGDCE